MKNQTGKSRNFPKYPGNKPGSWELNPNTYPNGESSKKHVPNIAHVYGAIFEKS